MDGVVGHGARAGLRGQALDGWIAGSGGVDDGEDAVAAEEAKASEWAALKPAASGPSPMEGLARSLPVAESMTEIFLPSQTGKRRWPRGIEGEAGGGIAAGGPGGGDGSGAGVDADDLALVFEVVEDVALAVGDGELGLAVERDGGDDGVGLGSMTETSWERPLKAQTVCVAGSKRMPSGPVPAGMVAVMARVERSNATTALAPPSVM